ncbi:TPA: RHS repeat protein [Escherichia coli]|nr:RHS repeat protein [Escherichia coli]HBD5614410.1 RHS repeat protein [Escherichia coli]HBD5637768.1 RHS repeat protein [Escherichia coli]
MSGKPAARQGDMTQYGGPIVQGSAGVRIGAPTGVACSVCPGGMTSGNPVNPLLGAKVLPGETDLALPGPLPFILSRTYSSYRTRTPAPVGVFGPGWKAPSDIRLQLRDDALVLNDNGGRSIHFEPLLPGEAVYSRSESMWLVRGGKAAQPDGHTLARLWGALPPDIRLSPHLYLATNSAQGPWWILGWSERVPGAEDVLPAPLPPYRELTGLADRFGRTLTYRREAAGDLAGEITGVTDGAGREFRLVLTTQAQRAEPEETWYGWDGDRLTTVQTDTTRIQTVYQPGSFAPLIRIETDNGEREKAQRRSLAEKLQQEGSEDGHGVVFPAELVRLLDRLEEEIRADRVSSESRQWLAQCGLTVEQLARQVEPEYTPARKVHFYHCDHRGLPLALISEEGNTVWSAEYDEWGNLLNEENPHHLHQPYRLPGQQHDEESGLYYNRHRYYDPLQGRYITQDPIGLEGGWNLYNYPLNPIIRMDPLGLYNLYQLLYDVWHDDSYGTSSIDITGSGDLISLGGHAGLGVAFAKKKGEMLSDICIYATACGHAGIGGGINAAITYSETKSLPTSGVSNSVGVTVGGGVGGHFAYTYVVDVDNPESSTESVGIGAGVDASVMTLACRTWQECWVN